MNKKGESSPLFSDRKMKLLNNLIHGAGLTFMNAEALFQESEMLAVHGVIARAYLLHQISMEECGKIELIAANVMQLIVTGEFGEKKLRKALRSHESKNKTNAYFLEMGAGEREAFERGDVEEGLKIFDEIKKRFHQDSNVAKNDALYVDYRDGAFLSPLESISREMLVEIKQRNFEFIKMAKEKVSMLCKIGENPEPYRELFGNIEQSLQKHKEANPDDPNGAMDIVLEKILRL